MTKRRNEGMTNDLRDTARSADMSADDTGEVVGGTVGGLGGAAGGAALGSLAGPVGTIIGAIAGAAGGWWAGKEITEAAQDYTNDDERYYRSTFDSRSTGRRGSRTFEDARPFYQLGHLAGRNPQYQGRSFDEVEGDLQRAWTPDLARKHGEWSDVRDYVGDAFQRSNEQRITLAEEELQIGKRTVQAGEVSVRKHVETEHVTERVPVRREEVTVERRPVNEAAGADVEIGEDSISVPLMEEDVVVEKRPVVKEEILLNKRVVQDTENVEADLRRERVDIDDSGIAPKRDADRESGLR